MFDVTTYINRRHELSSGIESGIILLSWMNMYLMNVNITDFKLIGFVIWLQCF